MRRFIRTFILSACLLTAPLFLSNVFADAPPDPGGGGPGGGDLPVGGGAPLGSGLITMLALGAGYGLRKIYKVKKFIK